MALPYRRAGLATVLKHVAVAILQLQLVQGAKKWRPQEDGSQGDGKPRDQLILQYGPFGGLFNQHQSHAIALLLAEEMKADVLEWPPNRGRQTFDESQGDTWTFTDVSKRYDVESISEYGAQRDIDVRFTPAKEYQPPADDHIEICFKDGSPTGFKVPMGIELRRGHDVGHLSHLIKNKIKDLKKQYPRYKNHPVRVVARVLFGAVNKHQYIPALKNIHFAPHFKVIARNVTRDMRDMFGASSFNGIHLRVEQDIAPIAEHVGGWSRLWALYREQLLKARLNSTAPMFMASGLIGASRTSTTELSRLLYFVGELTAEFARQVVFKDIFLSDGALVDFTADDQAIIDFEILKAADKVVTLDFSSFSQNLQNHRELDGAREGKTFSVRIDQERRAEELDQFAGRSHTMVR